MLRGKLKYLEKQLPLKSALTQKDSEEENSKLSDIGRAKKTLNTPLQLQVWLINVTSLTMP